MKQLVITIKEMLSREILCMRLTDMYCKHVIKTNEFNMSNKSIALYEESCKVGYEICNWGLHSGNPSNVSYHLSKIKKMEEDNYNHAMRVVICKYDFCDMPIIWIDNLHTAIKYVRQFGKDVKLRDIPFYVVDISDYEKPVITGYNSTLSVKYEDILGALGCAYKRYRRSNSKELIEIRYTLEDFLNDNPELCSI